MLRSAVVSSSRVMVSVLIAATVVAGCGKSSKAGSSRLYTDAEVARERAELASELDANAKRACKRPVLVGTPTPGPATTDIMAVVEPTAGPLVDCATRLDKLAATSDLIGDAKAHAPSLVDYDQTCGAPLEAAIRAAIQHEDAFARRTRSGCAGGRSR